MAENLEFPGWDALKPNESLNSVYRWAIAKAEERILWYSEKRKIKRTGSQLIRGFVALFIAIGALCPLVDATGVFGGPEHKIAFSQWGYLSLAMAAAIFGFDRFFGLSTGWMRFIVTQMSIDRTLKEFQHDWIILSAQQVPCSANNNYLIPLQRVKDFTLQVENLAKQETDSWVIEFQSNISHLEKILKTETDARKPGSIRVTVTNAREFEHVTIWMNGCQVKDLIGITEGLIDSVPPGQYEITSSAIKNNKELKDTKVIRVEPESITLVELTLPPSG
ncbi:MAG TPA: SLATT domain-containing protein [Bacillota bacterium]|nr:SLATT domain-containing protein [Bacillota bacterium]